MVLKDLYFTNYTFSFSYFTLIILLLNKPKDKILT